MVFFTMDDLKKKVLEKIDSMRDELIKFHQDIVRIPSENPPGKYKPAGDFIQTKMDEIGLDTKNIKNNIVGNVYHEDGPSLILYSHFDTVEAFKGWKHDPFGGEIEDGKIFGRGSADDKSSVTATIFATQALLECGVKLKGRLTLAAVNDEEMGGIKGARLLLEKGHIKGDACLVGESFGEYPVAYFGGGIFMVIQIIGKISHGMNFPDLANYKNKYTGISSIQKMVKVINFLNELQIEFNKTESKYPNFNDMPARISHINIGTIQGGNKISTVPNRCVLTGSINTIPEQDVESIIRRIREYAERFKKEDPELNIQINIPITHEPQIMDTNTRLAQILRNSYKTIFNEEREFKFILTTTDSHYFQEYGIETFLVGAGTAECNNHAADEFIKIEDLIKGTKVIALSALNYLR